MKEKQKCQLWEHSEETTLGVRKVQYGRVGCGSLGLGCSVSGGVGQDELVEG